MDDAKLYIEGIENAELYIKTIVIGVAIFILVILYGIHKAK
jgi:hypothetical protein